MHKARTSRWEPDLQALGKLSDLQQVIIHTIQRISFQTVKWRCAHYDSPMPFCALGTVAHTDKIMTYLHCRKGWHFPKCSPSFLELFVFGWKILCVSPVSTPAGTILRYCMIFVLCVCSLFGLLFYVKSRKGIPQWVLKESTLFPLGCKIYLSVIFY